MIRSKSKGLYARIKAHSEYHLRREGIVLQNTHNQSVTIKVLSRNSADMYVGELERHDGQIKERKR